MTEYQFWTTFFLALLAGLLYLLFRRSDHD